MKAVPILIITNALALALVLILWVQYSDLEAQVGSSRSGARSADVATDTIGLQDRLDKLEARFAVRRDTDSDGPGSADAPARTEDGSDAPPAAGATDGDAPKYNAAEMNDFRLKVREAQRLNAEEDRVNRVVDRIDRLEEENKIGKLTRKQKETVAKTILDTRSAIPDIWRRMRENNDLRSMSREERGALMRSEYDSLRADAQKSLEDVVPAADAKTIIEDAMSAGNMWGRGGDGGRATSRRGRPGR